MMMQAISNWCRYISTCNTGLIPQILSSLTLSIEGYLDSAVVKKNPDLAAEIWEGDFKADFAKSEHEPVVEVKSLSKIIKTCFLTCSGVVD
jgi:hypothetical protein